MSDQERAERSAKAMYDNDIASRELGIVIEAVAPGSARLRMSVVKRMLNGHSTCHGGYLFTLADSAFAFACNTFNKVAVASSAGIEFMLPAYLGDELTAEASMQSQGRRTGLYDVIVSDQKKQRIAMFRGRSHRLGDALFDEKSEPET